MIGSTFFRAGAEAMRHILIERARAKQSQKRCGLGWRMPILVTWINSANAEVSICEIPLLKIQRQAIEADLSAAATHREQNKWFVPRAALEKIALKSDRTDPEDVVVWNRPETDPTVEADFVDAYCKQRGVPHLLRNPEVFAYIWATIQKFMLHRLLLHEKDVDLGLAKLSAVCARANWKNVVIGRMIARRRNGVRTDTEKTRRETRRLLHQSVITAYDAESRTAQWNLAITPQKAFDDLAQVKEIERKRARGSYGFQLLKLLKSHGHKNRMHEILTAYWQRTQVPCAALPHGYEPKNDDGAEPAVDLQPAPKWSPTPVVDGATMKERDGLVAIDSGITPGELRRLVNAA